MSGHGRKSSHVAKKLPDDTLFATGKQFESYKRISDTQVAVWVSDYLQNTMHGLGLAVNKIPFGERKKFCAYRYAGEYRDSDGRWWLIDVGLREPAE